MDPKEIRNRLGLPEEATDEQVRAAIKELNTVMGVAEEPDPDGDDDSDDGDGEGDGEEEGASALVPALASALPEGVVAIDKATLDALRAGASTALALKADSDKASRETAVAAAIGDGRIPPARKDYWLDYLEKDPGAIQTLASLEKGLVPVKERGHGHAPDTSFNQDDLDAETVDGWTVGLFPEVRQTRAQDAAIASGAPRRSRIVTDAHGSR